MSAEDTVNEITKAVAEAARELKDAHAQTAAAAKDDQAMHDRLPVTVERVVKKLEALDAPLQSLNR